MLSNSLLLSLASPFLGEMLKEIQFIEETQMKTLILPDVNLEDMVCFNEMLLGGWKSEITQAEVESLQTVAKLLNIESLLFSLLVEEQIPETTLQTKLEIVPAIQSISPRKAFVPKTHLPHPNPIKDPDETTQSRRHSRRERKIPKKFKNEGFSEEGELDQEIAEDEEEPTSKRRKLKR